MFIISLMKDGERAGIEFRPVCVDTEAEAVVLAEEAVKRYIKREDIVLVPAGDTDFYVVQIKRTAYLVTIKRL